MASSVEKESTKAAGAGSRILSRFALRTGGLFQSLDRQLGDFGGPFTGNLTTIGTSLRTVAAGERNATLGASEFQRVGTAAYIGLGLAAVGFAGVSIKSALGAEQAQAQLEQAVKATGHSFETFSGPIDEAIKHLAQFGFDQEEVNASLAKLTRASKDPAKALELIGIAADVARAKNTDLGSASQILVNIEAGRVRGLAQLGISTKDANGNTVTATEALRRITALYGGAAAANAKTYAGQLQAVGAEAHNLEEEIGGKLLPIVADLGKDLLAGVHGLEAVNRASGGWLGTLAGAGFVAGAAAVAVTKISGGISHLVELFGVQKVATEAATAAEAANITVTEADAVAQGTLATASATTATAMQGEAASAGILSTSFKGLAGPLAAVAIGFIGGKKAGDEINKVLSGNKPNVDRLTASLIELEKHPHGGSTINVKKFAEDIGGQVGTDAINPIKGLEAIFSSSAHKAKDDAKAFNEALLSILQTEGVDKARLAYGLFQQQFAAAGGDAGRLAGDLEPALAAFDLADAKADKASGSVDKLAASFGDLAKGFTDQAAVLSLADQFDQAKKAADDLAQLKLDALGLGQKSIDAAHAEMQAQQSLSSAYDSERTAATSLADAKAKLAQFDSPTDQRIRDLEHQQILGRVVTTPEEARQKEIDLLKFDEDNSNKRADLQKQIASAEQSVKSATDGVAKAQEGVAIAAEARRTIQTDAAAGIAAGERKATEAALAFGTALETADAAGQLGKGNQQLSIWVSLLDGLLKQVDPKNPQIKNLDDFINKLSLANVLKGALGPHGPVGAGRIADVPQTPERSIRSLTPGPGLRPVGPGGASGAHIDFHPTTTIHASDVPTESALNTMYRKQGIRLAALIPA